MENLINFFNCGSIFKYNTRPNIVYFRVTMFKDITKKVIPFFKKYNIQGVKAKDFAD
jgi:hypothetical protein